MDWRPLWEQTKEICVKTVLCGHDHIKKEVNNKIKSDYNCYKLFGFDILYDENLKPWLIEVNNIPSLFHNTIDSFVNQPMVREMFNIVGFHIPAALATKHGRNLSRHLDLDNFGVSNLGYDERLYTKVRLDQETEKEDEYSGELESLLEQLTPHDVRLIIRAEEELQQVGGGVRSVSICHVMSFRPRAGAGWCLVLAAFADLNTCHAPTLTTSCRPGN